MKGEVARDFKDGAKAFVDVVWPKISDLLGGGKLIQAQRELDNKAGIDFLQTVNGGLRGLGVRVQLGADYRTFTIRKERPSGVETEYQKRVDALGSGEGLLYPHLTIHAYVSRREDGELWSAGIIETRELFNQLERFAGTRHVEFQRAHNGGEKFVAMRWRFLGRRMYATVLLGRSGRESGSVTP